jgi:hypothetical protein
MEYFHQLFNVTEIMCHIFCEVLCHYFPTGKARTERDADHSPLSSAEVENE